MCECDLVIRVTNVSKLFLSGDKPHSLFRKVMTAMSRDAGQLAGERFAALDCINLEVRGGDVVAVIGNNGAGKSTLLRIVAGLYAPTSGKVEMNGRPVLLAGLGVGMVDELRVEHNVFLYGAMHGLSRQNLRTKVDEILEWAGLTDFRHAPLKTLSTGMRSRLAFSVTRYFNSGIYLLDEALTAGDMVFREKCREVFAQYERNRKTLLVATHDSVFVERYCNKVLWLQKGRQMGFGPPEMVLPLYQRAREAKPCLV